MQPRGTASYTNLRRFFLLDVGGGLAVSALLISLVGRTVPRQGRLGAVDLKLYLPAHRVSG